MAEILSAYLRDAALRPFAWGEDDCATFVIKWFDRAIGPEAIDLWRGQYADRAACEAFIARGGGFVRIASEFLRNNYGLREGAATAAGNAVYARYKGIDAMGLRLSGDEVALRTEAGLLLTRRAAVHAEWGC